MEKNVYSNQFAPEPPDHVCFFSSVASEEHIAVQDGMDLTPEAEEEYSANTWILLLQFYF